MLAFIIGIIAIAAAWKFGLFPYIGKILAIGIGAIIALIAIAYGYDYIQSHNIPWWAIAIGLTMGFISEYFEKKAE